VIFIGRKLFNLGRESNKTARRFNSNGRRQKSAGTAASQVRWLVMVIGKAPPDGQSDKKHGTSSSFGNPED
jgi:hypothetical protein